MLDLKNWCHELVVQRSLPQNAVLLLRVYLLVVSRGVESHPMLK